MAIIKTVEGKTPKWGKNCFIAENATLTGDCVLGDDCSIWYSAVLRSDVDAIRCGNRVNVQDCACIHQTGTMPDTSRIGISRNNDKLQNMEAETKKRCFWCNLQNPLYVEYHDKEWGVPVHDDRKLFEMLLLESFQAGLSWECILNKREAFRKAFDDFDYRLIAKYDEEKQEDLRQDTGIIRNKLKIKAAVNNAQVFMDIQKEYGSFDQYIWGFTHGKTIYENHLTSSPLSDEVSKDLYRRGMRFVGTTIIYSYLQAIGIIFSHEDDCFLAQNL